MTDGLGISRSGAGAANASRTIYQSEGVREVQSRAQFLEQGQSPQERAGLTRLDRLLDAGSPLDTNAPRGFYLNIRV